MNQHTAEVMSLSYQLKYLFKSPRSFPSKSMNNLNELRGKESEVTSDLEPEEHVEEQGSNPFKSKRYRGFLLRHRHVKLKSTQFLVMNHALRVKDLYRMTELGTEGMRE